MRSKGLSNCVDVCPSVCLSVFPSVCLSLCPSVDQNINNQLKYTVICFEKGTVTTFELFFEGHNAVHVIYDLWELQIQSFLISYYSPPAPPL